MPDPLGGEVTAQGQRALRYAAQIPLQDRRTQCPPQLTATRGGAPPGFGGHLGLGGGFLRLNHGPIFCPPASFPSLPPVPIQEYSRAPSCLWSPYQRPHLGRQPFGGPAVCGVGRRGVAGRARSVPWENRFSDGIDSPAGRSHPVQASKGTNLKNTILG